MSSQMIRHLVNSQHFSQIMRLSKPLYLEVKLKVNRPIMLVTIPHCTRKIMSVHKYRKYSRARLNQEVTLLTVMDVYRQFGNNFTVHLHFFFTNNPVFQKACLYFTILRNMFSKKHNGSVIKILRKHICQVENVKTLYFVFQQYLLVTLQYVYICMVLFRDSNFLFNVRERLWCWLNIQKVSNHQTV